ncbi:MAG: hypothetical protein CMI03_12555 [Oceanospirillaceae bacterium]|uniref:DUF3135 domain-containing protein n=1 Tax=unclassified Thalassolituus TaxID=2624967 RepID=UPI000C430407|nr:MULTISPECIES: DUF3135 domain-containing protein [unclassified Thalassolituus]MBS53566.1 hypothetical protein [Oceanospirillaceae bacterium]|tara:strand:+ start:347 stop:676 length:330 start_codon:yes stop_codon:yes gene_type:complete
MQLPSFEELRKLAETNPDKLESLRQTLIEDTIASAPDDIQRRLRGLQFRIDAERQLASNPMSACIRISAMMNERLHSLMEALNTPTGELPAGRQQPSASILSFPLIANS